MTFRIARSFAMAAVAAATLAAQEPAAVLRIASPSADAYLSGPVRLVAHVDPPAFEKLVSQITFFAGGQQVCTIVRQPFQCDWDAGDRIVEQQIRAVAQMRDGSRIVGNVRTRGLKYAEVTHVDVIQVTAVVTDGDGRFVRGLKESDFEIYEDDKPQKITHFAAENIPLELVTAIDISSSMSDALPLVKQAAKQFLGGLQPADQVTVLGFNENLFTLARRSTDQGARERAVDRMAPWGGTALYDVILRSIDLLGRQSGRRAIVLFSDGDDQSSHATLQTAMAKAEGSDATIYSIGQGRAVRSQELQRLLRRLADVSGGRAFFTENQQSLNATFNEILEDLRSQYLLAYAPPATSRDGNYHRIKVATSRGNKVRARQGYRLPKA